MTDSPVSFPLVGLNPEGLPGHSSRPLLDVAHTGGHDNDQHWAEPVLKWGAVRRGKNPELRSGL